MPAHRSANLGRSLRKGEGTAADRFWDRVEKSDGCWIWRAGTKNSGYGVFAPTHGDVHMAHRYSWFLHFGPVPDGMLVCHTCDTKLCVRPDHLFLGTPQANMEDMRQKGRARWGTYNAIKTHCKHGHEFDETYRDQRGRRMCRTCRTWKARQERKAARNAARAA
jgi:hypothetical protein